MSRFVKYLNERKGKYGKGISFIDIDDTLAWTKARIYVTDKDTGEIKHKLSTGEFREYELKDNEQFDYREMRDGVLFRETSDPIPSMIKRTKRMLSMLKKNTRGSRIVFLTGRLPFNNEKEFEEWFRDQGIDIDFPDLTIEKAGGLEGGTLASKKKRIIMDYLQRDDYRRIRMFDDDLSNLKQFLSIAENVPDKVIESVREAYNIPEGELAQE